MNEGRQELWICLSLLPAGVTFGMMIQVEREWSLSVNQSRIPVAGPWITEKEINYVTDAVKTAWYDDAGRYHQQFEERFAAYVNRRYAISLPSCTSGLHLALAALGINAGDEVIVPEITWIASAAPIHYVGATPVFADMDAQTWCLSAESLEAHITSKTKAVIVVDLYGNMPEMDRLIEIAKRYNIALIEDAAQAIGSTYNNRPAGSFGTFSTFSFHGSKTLTTGEGGMLVTDDSALAECCLFLRDHGRAADDSRLFWNTEVAYKYKMSSMQAALGLAQLERVNELVQKKREIFAWYDAELKGIEGLTLNFQAENVRNSYWMVTALLNPELGWDKEQLMPALKHVGVDTRPFFYPLSQLPAFAHLPQSQRAESENPIAYRLHTYGLNLPSALILEREDVRFVCDQLKTVLTQRSASLTTGRPN